MMIMNPIMYRISLGVRVFHQWSYVPVMMDIQLDIRIYTLHIYVSRKEYRYSFYIYFKSQDTCPEPPTYGKGLTLS